MKLLLYISLLCSPCLVAMDSNKDLNEFILTETDRIAASLNVLGKRLKEIDYDYFSDTEHSQQNRREYIEYIRTDKIHPLDDMFYEVHRGMAKIDTRMSLLKIAYQQCIRGDIAHDKIVMAGPYYPIPTGHGTTAINTKGEESSPKTSASPESKD
jgi:hypothetical protein